MRNPVFPSIAFWLLFTVRSQIVWNVSLAAFKLSVLKKQRTLTSSGENMKDKAVDKQAVLMVQVNDEGIIMKKVDTNARKANPEKCSRVLEMFWKSFFVYICFTT